MNELEGTDWNQLESMSADDCAMVVTGTILKIVEKHIPESMLVDKKSIHPWINQRIVELVN